MDWSNLYEWDSHFSLNGLKQKWAGPIDKGGKFC